MKVLNILAVAVLGALGGCVAVDPDAAWRHGYPDDLRYRGQGHRAGYARQGEVHPTPCQPYRADGLMDWAKGAGSNSQHSRSANVDTRNGRVECRTSESASSSSFKK